MEELERMLFVSRRHCWTVRRPATQPPEPWSRIGIFSWNIYYVFVEPVGRGLKRTVAARPRPKGEEAIRATVKCTPNASSLLRARRERLRITPPGSTSLQCSRVLRTPSCTVYFTRRVSRLLVRSHHKHLVRRRLVISRRHPPYSPMSLAALDLAHVGRVNMAALGCLLAVKGHDHSPPPSRSRAECILTPRTTNIKPLFCLLAVHGKTNVSKLYNVLTANIKYPGATLAERLACSPPTKAIRVQSPAASLWIFACGNRAGRCRWSAGFLVDLPFPRPLIPALLHTHPHRLSRPRSFRFYFERFSFPTAARRFNGRPLVPLAGPWRGGVVGPGRAEPERWRLAPR
ncbi:hypothetical protein PR048_024065 [Dryococelus australis]|uniref:Uncharacterized protein n=1 Tax=Dryococelus australis TaxID=614101 RepID=A0ABQ9GVY1_9NEOP|nr:hypothetical protein PR048_024065 [Dryococelus australis]